MKNLRSAATSILSAIPIPIRIPRPSRVASVLLAMGLAGCHPADRSGAAESKSPAPAAESAPLYPESDYSEHEAGHSGGVLRVSVETDTGSLDLHTISDTNAQWLGRILYDNLVYLDARGEVVPWLATSWTISPDGLTYTFHLREGVTFSDGTPFDAEAVRVNLEHMRDPATKSPLAGKYIEPYLDGRVVDSHTFEAHLRYAYTPFLNVLAQSWLSLESPRAIRENPRQLGEHPVGSGPFTVERYVKQQGITFVRRPDYAWAPPYLHHAGAAYLERIEVEFVPEPSVRHGALVSGQHDFTIDAPPQAAASLRADPNFFVNSRVRQGNPLRGICFNTSRPPFDDVRLRRALALAVDREGIARMVGFGEYRTKSDYLASNTRYYTAAYAGALRRNVAEAERLLDAAGWTGRDADGIRLRDGHRLSADVIQWLWGPAGNPVLIAIKEDARRIGVELRLRPLPTSQVLPELFSGSYQAIGDGVWHTNTPDGLTIIYHSGSIPTEKFMGWNTSRLQDALLDDLLDRARRTTDPVLLADLYGRAQGRLVELVPTIPLFENHTLIAYHRRVHGLVYDTSHNTPVFTTVWLEDAPR
jgi:peptide/nickel transport system substrate-binding protein